MITSLFRKSTLLNYSAVVIGVLVFFFLCQIHEESPKNVELSIIKRALLLTTILASLFISNFIVKKNALSKDSAYTVLFYFILLLFFPQLWSDFNLVLSNFFVLLALRRLISLQSPRAPKEKIFDASLWVFVACLFHFWSILYIVLVFIAILFHVARDYRNWFLPFIAFFTIASIFFSTMLIFDASYIQKLLSQTNVDCKINYFINNYQNLALSIYATMALFFMTSLLLSLSNRPLMLHSSYKKIISAFFIGVVVFVISPNKSNDVLVFTIAPLAMMATSHIEIAQIKWQKEVVLFAVILLAIFSFFSQL